MEKFTETIEAASPEDAQLKAVEIFGVENDNISITSVGDGVFFASVKNLDAEVRFFVPEDNMSVQIQHIHGHLGEGRKLTGQLLRETLSADGVVVPVSDEIVAHILDRVRGGESLDNFVVAEGKAPVDGRDGVLELKVQTEMSAGSEDENDRVDYHERGFVETVKKGEILGHITFASEGLAGTDVFGKPVAAKSGKSPGFEAGEFVSLDDEGTIRANKSGMVQFVHGVLSITELFEHPGDVDFHTGNMHMDEGSLLVRGTVQSGFEVSARGNVIIGKTVREASIESGGDIELKQGTIESSLKAKGAVFAKFAQNATIEADGNVVVANNLHNCTVTAGDSVLVTTGKGIVRGGIIRCAVSFEAKELGCDNEVDTVVELGQRTADEQALYEERASIKANIAEINKFLGCEDGAPDMSGKNEKEQQAILKVLETLQQLQKRRSDISSQLAAQNRDRLSNARFCVNVLKMAYPGARIVILGRPFVVKTPLARCMFTYSPEKDKVIVESI